MQKENGYIYLFTDTSETLVPKQGSVRETPTVKKDSEFINEDTDKIKFYEDR